MLQNMIQWYLFLTSDRRNRNHNHKLSKPDLWASLEHGVKGLCALGLEEVSVLGERALGHDLCLS